VSVNRTTTEADAGRYEAVHGDDYDPMRPTRGEAAADAAIDRDEKLPRGGTPYQRGPQPRRDGIDPDLLLAQLEAQVAAKRALEARP
jgi:hypothetical protein